MILELNKKRITHSFKAIINTAIKEGKQKSNTVIAWEFSCLNIGIDKEGNYRRGLKTDHRYILSEQGSIVKKLNSAQKIALLVAGINDNLEILVDKNNTLIKVINTDEVREKWNKIKSEILLEMPSLKQMVTDFTWQLKEENIQEVFKADNFFNFFFTGIFNQATEEKKELEKTKIINNALGSISIPIKELVKITPPKNRFSTIGTIKLDGEIDTEHPQFSLPKLNSFLGKFAQKGEEHNLDFKYKGNYKIATEKGLIVEGSLQYLFKIGNVYNNETTITFNIQDNE